MTAPQVVLHRGREGRIADGHLWVFEGEIARVRGNPRPGDAVTVVTARGRFCGRGFYNPHSRIRVRLLTLDDEPVDEALFRRRLAAALALRRRIVAEATAFRLVHGEGDLLPGLIVDRYAELIVMQTLSLGMDVRRDLLADLLLEQTGAQAIYLRNDPPARALEGLPQEQGFLRGRAEVRVEITEAASRFVVDIERGQKTGWFCDQRENRLAASALASGGEVLDVFCYTGGFGIHAALVGARSVVGLDASDDAVALARVNAARNGVGDVCTYQIADAFDELRVQVKAGRHFDMVILDPPAFAKRAASVTRAVSGYKEINLQALRLLRPGGYLVTCSCSQHVDETTFFTAVLDAASDAGCRLRLLEARSQARDHPMLAAMPETRYLKCFLMQVI